MALYRIVVSTDYSMQPVYYVFLVLLVAIISTTGTRDKSSWDMCNITRTCSAPGLHPSQPVTVSWCPDNHPGFLPPTTSPPPLQHFPGCPRGDLLGVGLTWSQMWSPIPALTRFDIA